MPEQITNDPRPQQGTHGEPITGARLSADADRMQSLSDVARQHGFEIAYTLHDEIYLMPAGGGPHDLQAAMNAIFQRTRLFCGSLRG